jgi:hypothetical protein
LFNLSFWLVIILAVVVCCFHYYPGGRKSTRVSHVYFSKRFLREMASSGVLRQTTLAGRAYQDHRSHLPEDPLARFFSQGSINANHGFEQQPADLASISLKPPVALWHRRRTRRIRGWTRVMRPPRHR